MNQFNPSFLNSNQQAPLSSRSMRYLALGVFLLYWLVLFAGTHIPRPERIVSLGGNLDKVVHFTGYMGLAYFACMAWTLARPASRPLRLGNYLIILALAGLYGAFDEISQEWVNRTTDLEDWYANMLGAFAGVTFFAATFAIGRKIVAINAAKRVDFSTLPRR